MTHRGLLIRKVSLKILQDDEYIFFSDNICERFFVVCCKTAQPFGNGCSLLSLFTFLWHCSSPAHYWVSDWASRLSEKFYPDAGERCIRIGAILALKEMTEKFIEMPNVAQLWLFAFYSGNLAVFVRKWQQISIDPKGQNWDFDCWTAECIAECTSFVKRFSFARSF